MNNDESFLEDLLQRNDFLVKVVLLDTGVLAVDYAANKQVVYQIEPVEINKGDEVNHYLWNVQYECNGIVEEFVLSGPVVRLFILMDIFQQCRRLNLPDTIVRFYTKEKKQATFMDILPLDLSEEEIKKEKLLNQAMERAYNKPQMINQMDAKLEKMGLLKQFSLLKGLLV